MTRNLIALCEAYRQDQDYLILANVHDHWQDDGALFEDTICLVPLTKTEIRGGYSFTVYHTSYGRIRACFCDNCIVRWAMFNYDDAHVKMCEYCDHIGYCELIPTQAPIDQLVCLSCKVKYIDFWNAIHWR